MEDEDLSIRAVSYFRAVSSGAGSVRVFTPQEMKDDQYVVMDKFIHFTNARTQYGANIPCYIHEPMDMIMMPYRNQFLRPERFYEVNFHELIHWTGARKRLNRRHGFRTAEDRYSYEEFVGQFGGNLVLEHFGLEAGNVNFSYFEGYAGSSGEAEAMLAKAEREANLAFEYLLEVSERNQRLG